MCGLLCVTAGTVAHIVAQLLPLCPVSINASGDEVASDLGSQKTNTASAIPRREEARRAGRDEIKACAYTGRIDHIR